MTNPTPPMGGSLGVALIAAFPVAGPKVELAYKELEDAAGDKAAVQAALGPRALMQRPWDPPTCRDPDLRAQVWDWLEQVVIWLNREYVWDVDGMIPACWPQHPHLVHEVALLADKRRRAGHALTGEPLEEFHRYVLPAFTDRMRQRLRAHCEDKVHQPWPSRGRHTRHRSDESIQQRARAFEADVATLAAPSPPQRQDRSGAHLRSVDSSP